MAEKYSCAEYVTKHTVNYSDTSPLTLCTVKDGCSIREVVIEVTTTWNDGSKAFEVGDEDDSDGFIEDIGSDLESTGYKVLEHDDWGDYIWDAVNKHRRNKQYSGAKNITATFVGQGNGDNQGVCVVYLIHRTLK